MKILLAVCIFCCTLFASGQSSEKEIRKMIANMIILGFKGESVVPASQIYKDVKSGLGGVILFDKDPNNKKKIKNIKNPKQLKELTKKLQEISKEKLFISIDQEGGKVQRMTSKNGFFDTLSAVKFKKYGEKYAQKSYAKLANALKNSGINLNFAPDVDVAINKNNPVIVKIGRSYGNVKSVEKYAEIFIDEQKKVGVISVLKHFPGHGSSLKDSHDGFVNITNTWKSKELEPYKYFIKKKKADVIMSAHVFNKNLDSKYPATLSHDVNTKLLRGKLGFDGVIISDDLQMNAIIKHYSLKQTVTLAINSGVNILLFANQQAKPVKLSKLVDIIYNQYKSGKIPLDKIINSNKKIEKLKYKISSLEPKS